MSARNHLIHPLILSMPACSNTQMKSHIPHLQSSNEFSSACRWIWWEIPCTLRQRILSLGNGYIKKTERLIWNFKSIFFAFYSDFVRRRTHSHVRRTPVALHNSSIFHIHVVDIGGVWQRCTEHRCRENIYHMRHVGWMWVFLAAECG